MDTVPTTALPKNAIDSGATGEKVGHAAAPLGTDAEAGGRPPSRRERAMKASSQIKYREPVPPNGVLIYGVTLVLVLGAIVSTGNIA